MYPTYKNILILLLGFTCTLASLLSAAQGNGGGRTFDINSSTLIIDTEGNYIDFQTFTRLSPVMDYGELMPEFDDQGNLKLIKIKLLRKIDPEAQKAQIITTSPAPAGRSSVPRKFRFTTASELEGLDAPHYKEKDLKGREVSTSTMAGKVVVVKFWFMRCGPCLEEMPELAKLAARYKGNPDVKFIAPSTDDLAAMKRFSSKRTFGYTILPDAYDFHGDFKVAGYPTHLVIQRDGIVREVVTGKNSSLTSVLGRAIDEALFLGSDDLSVNQIPRPMYVDGLVIKDESGLHLSKEAYHEKLADGPHFFYERVKMDGRKEILLKKQK